MSVLPIEQLVRVLLSTGAIRKSLLLLGLTAAPRARRATPRPKHRKAAQGIVTRSLSMTDWTAQTRQNKISVTPYIDDDTTSAGFMSPREPAVWMGDYGYVIVMPARDRHAPRRMRAPCPCITRTSRANVSRKQIQGAPRRTSIRLQPPPWPA